MWNHSIDPEVLGNVLLILLVGLISGLHSLAVRINSGQRFTTLSIASEYSMSIMMGYLAFDAYPKLAPHLWDWITVWIVVATAAYLGGRLMLAAETYLQAQFDKFKNRV